MPDLGKKYECFNCGTKFYNLGKPEAICPKCGANQKNARTDDAPPPAPRPPRRPAILEPPIPDEPANEFGEEGPAPEESDSDDDDEFAEDDEAEEKERDEEEEF
jgi:predicted  nucleic acid-binding Zn-ribbon protein